jgi:hypothetical protein
MRITQFRPAFSIGALAAVGVITLLGQAEAAHPPEVIAYWCFARADGTNPDYSKDAWHPVILFSSEKDEDEALTECSKILSEDGWSLFVMKEAKVVDPARAKEAPKDFRLAWKGAQSKGCHVVIIEDRLKPEEEPKIPEEFKEQIE